MAKIKIYNLLHEDVGALELAHDIFDLEYNEPLIHQVVVALNNNARQGTKSTLTRSEVRGHAKKPWRQKGTGRARQGSSKGPQWKGGGIVFAPKPRDFSQKVNKKMRDLALCSALSEKIRQNEVLVLDTFGLKNIKTKAMVEILERFAKNKNILIVTPDADNIIIKSTANIPNADVTTTDLLNAYDVVASNIILFTVDAIKKLEEAYV